MATAASSRSGSRITGDGRWDLNVSPSDGAEATVLPDRRPMPVAQFNTSRSEPRLLFVGSRTTAWGAAAAEADAFDAGHQIVGAQGTLGSHHLDALSLWPGDVET